VKSEPAENLPVIPIADARNRSGYDWLSSTPSDDLSRLREEIIVASGIFPRLQRADFVSLTHLDTGQEHEVFLLSQAETEKCVIKITRDNTPGICLKLSYQWNKTTQNYDKQIFVRKGFPSEYVQRLHRQNSLFGDDTKILGVIIAEDAIQFVSSQAFCRGGHPQQSEVETSLKNNGFVQIPPKHIQNAYLCDYCYYRESDNLLFVDAKGSNFIKDDIGFIRPIDVVCQRPDKPLREFLNTTIGT
jgi:hypothetical protein